MTVTVHCHRDELAWLGNGFPCPMPDALRAQRFMSRNEEAEGDELERSEGTFNDLAASCGCIAPTGANAIIGMPWSRTWD
jgi:hypothetical protein